MRGMLAAVFTVTLALGASGLSAEDRSPLAWDFNMAVWGGDAGIGYRGLSLVPGVDTTFWLWGGASVEDVSYFRLPDGSLITGAAPAGVNAATDPHSWRWSLRWQLGLAQGLAWNEHTSADLAEAFVYYRGRRDWNLQDPAVPGQLAFLSAQPDRFGILQNALLCGLRYDDVLFDKKHKTRSGFSAEATVEWGPAFLANTLVGNADFTRLNATARVFLPLLALDSGSGDRLLSVYFGDFASVDYVLGAVVPLNVRQSFGGLDPRTGLGDAVRGVDSGAFDTNLKCVNSMDVRAVFPPVLFPDLVPGILAYWDIGAFSQVGEAAAAPQAGVLSSVGAAVFLDFFDITSFALYVHWRLTGVNADGTTVTAPWTFAALEFDLHF